MTGREARVRDFLAGPCSERDVLIALVVKIAALNDQLARIVDHPSTEIVAISGLERETPGQWVRAVRRR